MIPSTFDPLYFKSVLPTYSWDQGTPGVSLDSTLYTTSFASNSAVSTNNEEGVEYVGYAPFVYVSLSSFPGEVSGASEFLALERTVDFGDYYNSDNNLVTMTGLSNESFCHVYVMPGIYTIKYTRTEHVQYEYLNIDGFGNCLQKYCVDWSFASLSGSVPRKDPITWTKAKLYGSYEKLWSFEECEASYSQMAGLYIEPTSKAINHPLSWQWYNFLSQPLSIRNDPITWLSAGFQQNDQFTWKNSSGPCVSLPIEGITWRWDNLRTLPSDATAVQRMLNKQITWDETQSLYPGNATWDFVKQKCSIVGTIALSSIVETKTKTAMIRVKEIPPTAYLTVDQPEDRYSPLQVRLSPKDTICGSFPIEKIVWDLGDGSPIIEQRRWSNTLEAPFVYSGAAGDDYEDPRNYDVVHTYTRSADSPSTFYPSLTAYAANTYTSDSVSVMVGPIRYKNTTGTNFRLLQNELTDQGKALIGQIDDTNVGLWKIDTIFKEIVTISHPYFYFGYYSEDRPLVSGQSKLYTKIYSNSPPVVSLSGLYPIESFPNQDLWQTDKDGVITWSLYVVHPVSFNTFIDLDTLPAFETSFVQPYLSSDDYYVDTVQLTSGVSKLYESRGTAAQLVAGLENFDGVDLDKDGRLDTFSTNASGVITWAPTIFNTAYYAGLSGYTRTEILTSGVSKLYDGPYSDAELVRYEGGLAKFNGNLNTVEWATDSQGIITWEEVAAHPYLVGNPPIGYVDVLNFESGTQVLWDGRGTAAEPVQTLTESLTSYIDGNEDIDEYVSTDYLYWWMYQAHPYEFGDYYIDIGEDGKGDLISTEEYFSNQILWSSRGSSASKILTASGQISLVSEFADTELYDWQTDGDGRLTVSLLTAHPFLQLNEFYSDDEILVSKNIDDGILEGSPLWYGRGAFASRVLNVAGVGDADKDGNDDDWVISPIGHLTFSMISAYPFEQFYGFTSEPGLSSGISVIYNGKGTGATFAAVSAGVYDVDGDGNLDAWSVNDSGVLSWEMIILYPWKQFYGYSSTKNLSSGISLLWSGVGTGAIPLSGGSGIADVDREGNLDQWSTDENGVVTWTQINPHPWLQLGQFYSDFENLAQEETVLWDGPGTGADIVSNQTGVYDLDGDGNDEQWSTNSSGLLSWYTISAHPYAKFSFYSDTDVLTSGISKLWRGFGTGAVVAAEEFAQTNEDFIDIDGDGNIDEWDTDESGTIIFTRILVHTNIFLDTPYFVTESTLTNGETVLWNGTGTGATTVNNVSGTFIDIDQDGDDIQDTWSTDLSGKISWSKTILNPFQFPGLSGFVTTNYISSGVTVLWDSPYSTAQLVDNDLGYYVGLDGNLNTWSTNGSGIITSAMVSAHPYSQYSKLLHPFYTDTPQLVNGTTVLWSSQGTTASAVALHSAYSDVDADGDIDVWVTNESGVITWYMLSAHPYPQFYGYSDTPEIRQDGYTKLWTKPGSSAVAVALSSGTADVNRDGNLDEWRIIPAAAGYVLWHPITAHPYRQSIGYFTDEPTLTNGITQLWSGFGTGAVLLTSFKQVSDFIDLDEDGNKDVYSTDANAVISWYMLSAHPYRCLNSQYYATEDTLVSGQSRVYLHPGSGSKYLTGVSDFTNTVDINDDGDIGTYSIDDNGIITYTLSALHPYQIVKDLGVTGEVLYYADEPTITKYSTQIYNRPGTGATLVVSVTGVDYIDSDANRDVWVTDEQGRINWYMLSAYPFEQFYGYSSTSNLINNFTQLYKEKGTSSAFVNVSAGIKDIDGDGNLDVWSVSPAGVLGWVMLSAHMYSQFRGMISAADVSVVTTPISVAGNPVIPGTEFTYNLTFVPDTWNSNGITQSAYISSHPEIPWDPFQTYQLISAADVAPVVIDGVVQTIPLSVAGNPNIPDTEYTYRMVPRLDGYTDTISVSSGSTVLYNSQGTGAVPVTSTSGGGFIGVDEITWSTDQHGIITYNLVSAHPYFQFDSNNGTLSFYTDTFLMLSGITVLWRGVGTGALRAVNGAGNDDIDLDGTLESWYTDDNGVIFYELTKTVGVYFYTTTNFDWFNISNWYIEPTLKFKANKFPESTTNVIILTGSNLAYAAIDNVSWVEPASIDASRAGIQFYATVPTTVTCDVSGSYGFPVRFSGKARYQPSTGTLNGRFWKSLNDTNWYELSNWYYDRATTIQANALPLNSNNVVLLSGGADLYVDLDNPNWIQPSSITSEEVQITFDSNSNAIVDCPIVGVTPTFVGSSSYQP